MKFSLLFLVFLIAWAALAINGWNLQTKSSKLADELSQLKTRADGILITQYDLKQIEQAKRQRTSQPPIIELNKRLMSAVNQANYDAIDLSAVDCEFGLISSYRWHPANRMQERFSAHKIKLPPDRRVIVEFKLHDQGNVVQTKSQELPAGEYDLRLSCETETNRRDSIRAQVLSNRPDFPQLTWQVPLNFFANKTSEGRKRVGSGVIQIQPGANVVLLGRHFENTANRQHFYMEISIRDVTANE